MKTQHAAPTAHGYSRRLWREIKPLLPGIVLAGVVPAVITPIIAYLISPENQTSKHYTLASLIAYGGTALLVILLAVLRTSKSWFSETQIELESFRAFKARAEATPIYIGPRNYCLVISGKRVSVGIIVVRFATIKLSHCKVTVSGKHGEIFSHESNDPQKIRDTGEIILEKLLQQEEFDRIGDTDIFIVQTVATIEGEDGFRNFAFSAIPLRR